MNVIFIEPSFPHNQREFVRGLHAAGATVIGIGERPSSQLSDELRHWLSDYVQVRSVVHEPSLLEAVRLVQDKVWVDRLEATVEAHIMAAAAVREATGIPGTSVKTAYLCRDKPAMKEALRNAGIPCAQSTRATTPGEAREFATKVGYPLIVKPPAGAGASGTYRVRDDDALERVIRESGLADGEAMAVEEFIEGHEGFIDTVTVNGVVGH
jgi:carbamoylphosphate synthase large subunit